jgi:hypothetical protein
VIGVFDGSQNGSTQNDDGGGFTKWSAAEEQTLRDALKRGASLKDVADLLGRSVADVQQRVSVTSAAGADEAPEEGWEWRRT